MHIYTDDQGIFWLVFAFYFTSCYNSIMYYRNFREMYYRNRNVLPNRNKFENVLPQS